MLQAVHVKLFSFQKFVTFWLAQYSITLVITCPILVCPLGMGENFAQGEFSG